MYPIELQCLSQTKAASEFEAICVNPLKPFNADKTLEEEFYKAFEGIDVLPESLYSEYEALKEDDPILASELLVPISWRRYYGLLNQGRVLPRERHQPPVIDAKYNSQAGLLFEDIEDGE